jgi:hypothetical protein
MTTAREAWEAMLEAAKKALLALQMASTGMQPDGADEWHIPNEAFEATNDAAQELAVAIAAAESAPSSEIAELRALCSELEAELARRNKPCVWTCLKFHYKTGCGHITLETLEDFPEPYCNCCGHPVKVEA